LVNWGASGDGGGIEADRRDASGNAGGSRADRRDGAGNDGGANGSEGQGHIQWQAALSTYGTDLCEMMDRYEPADFESISARLFLCPAQVKWAVEFEMTQTLEDVLARRTACLFLDVEESLRIAPKVAAIMASLLSYSPEWASQQIDAYTQITRYFRMPEH